MSRSRQLRVAMLSIHSCPLGRPGTRDTGGMSIYVQNVAQCLGPMGIAVDIFTRRHQPASPPIMELAENVRLIHLPVGDNQEKIGLFPHLPDFARAICHFRDQEAVDYEIVHSHYWLSGVVGSRLADWWKIPHVTMLHTSARAKNIHLGFAAEPELRAEMEKKVLDSANLIVSATQPEKQDLVDLYNIKADKIAVIPCGVDLEAFRPLPKPWARRALGLDGLPVVLYVGRLQAEKGIELILEAVALLAGERAIQVMVVGGDASEQTEMERLRLHSQKLGIASLTRFQSAVDQDELPLYYSSADVLVLPSRYETFGLVAAEALACGIPVIASPVGAMPELVQRGKTGFLLDKHSPAHLANLLGHLLGDDDLQKRLAVFSRPAVASLSWSKVAERLAKEYYRWAGISQSRSL